MCDELKILYTNSQGPDICHSNIGIRKILNFTIFEMDFWCNLFALFL